MNWYESPGHQVLMSFASISHARMAGRRFRRLYVRVSSILKHRELLHLPTIRSFAYVGKSHLSHRKIDRLASWYIGDFFNRSATHGGTPMHTTFYFSSDDDRPMDLFAPALASGRHSNLIFAWSDSEPAYNYVDRYAINRVPPVNKPLDWWAYELDQFDEGEELHLQVEGVSPSQTNVPHEGWSRANDVLKSVAPGSYVIALSLPEDELGFCDDALREWLPLLSQVHKALPKVFFYLLDRTTLDDEYHDDLVQEGIIAGRSRGLNHLAALAVAQRADAFIGTMGYFAYTALGHRRPGVYLNPTAGDSHNAARKQWFLVSPSAETVISIFGGLFEKAKREVLEKRPPLLPKAEADVLQLKKYQSTVDKPEDKNVPEKPKWYVDPNKRRTVTLYIDVFGYCNLRCPSCPVGNWPKDEEKAYTAGMIKEETLRGILEKAQVEANVSSVGLFNWTEPLLNPDTPELIKLVRSYGLSCSISSNLNILRDPDALMESGVDWMRISVSGFTQEIYGRYHKNGDIERVKANMQRLADARDLAGAKTDIEVFFHKYLDNEDDETAMKIYAESLGFRFVSAWAYLMPVEKMLAVAEPDSNEFTGLSEQDQDLIDHLALSPTEALKVTRASKQDELCQLYEYLTIDINANIYLCCAASGKPSNRIGNFLEMPLSDIYAAQLKHDLCKSCVKHGLPTLYGHADPAFEKIGEDGRANWQAGTKTRITANS